MRYALNNRLMLNKTSSSVSPEDHSPAFEINGSSYVTINIELFSSFNSPTVTATLEVSEDGENWTEVSGFNVVAGSGVPDVKRSTATTLITSQFGRLRYTLPTTMTRALISTSIDVAKS